MLLINLSVIKWLFLLTKKRTLCSPAIYSALYKLHRKQAIYKNQKLYDLLISLQCLYFSKRRQRMVTENIG